MEIATLPKNALRLKGKKSTFIVNPSDKLEGYNAGIYLQPVTSFDSDVVKIAGAGDYEVAGIKIAGFRTEDDLVYSINLDDVSVLIGTVKALDKLQHKLKEHAVVIVWSDEAGSAAFATSLAVNVVIFYGEKAAEVVHSYAKENIQEMNKFSATVDKLPAEMQTILLADGK